MKKLLFAFAVIFFLTSLSTYSQSFSKHLRLYDVGLGYDMVSLDEKTATGTQTSEMSLLNMSLGVNLPIISVGQDMSIGVSPAITAAFMAMSDKFGTISQSDGFGNFQVIGVTIPLFLNFKYGTDADYKSSSTFGLTGGLGYRYTMLPGYSWGAPAIMGEINFRLSKNLGLLKLRYMTDFGHSIDDVSTLKQQSIFLLLTPNW